MRPVAVALLAAFLPAGLLIKKNTAAPLEPAPKPEIAIRDSENLPKRRTNLLDANKFEWRNDAIASLSHLDSAGTHRDGVDRENYLEPGDEAWAAEILAELGFAGGLSAPGLLSFLRDYHNYKSAITHLFNHIILSRLSLDGDPEDSFLPFTPEVHRCLRDFFKALEGTKLCPEIASLVSKIPFQLAQDYSKEHIGLPGEGTQMPIWNFKREVYERVSILISELFGPIRLPNARKYLLNRKGELRMVGPERPINLDGLADAVESHLRMMGSRQRFEWSWPGETTANGSSLDIMPSLLSFADPYGVLLQEPKVWIEGFTWLMTVDSDVKEDGGTAREQSERNESRDGSD